jgi:chemotaxis protein methyltransferase CheR
MSASPQDSSASWNLLIDEVCREVGRLTGNILTQKQRPMVESRMRRRLNDLKLTTPKAYQEHWHRNREEENKFLVGLLTTHFTSFFREFFHFEWIVDELPSMVKAARDEGRRELRFWSAACSKGQEVWSLGMLLHHHLPKIDPGMGWRVHGTDIDINSVKEAQNGVYHRREIETCPRHLWEGLWTRGKEDISDWYKVKSILSKNVSFSAENLLDLTMAPSEKFDVIMCRNVLIYFDRKTQEEVAKTLLKHLSPQGTLITGTSESLSGYGLEIKSVSPSVYKKLSAQAPAAPAAPQKKVEITPVLPKPLKVFCIDDSPTVIMILKKILSTEEFQIIGTAANGVEAIEKLKGLKPDVITLDIHMPEMDGPTFLKTSGIATQIPVVMVTSVDRDDDGLVRPLFNLGVIDFVEKPLLENMKEIGEELKQKLKMGWIGKKKNLAKSVDSSPVVKKVRSGAQIVITAGEADSANVLAFLRQAKCEKDQLFITLRSFKDAEAFKASCLKVLPTARNVHFFHEGGPALSALPVIWACFKGGDLAFLRKYHKKDHLVLFEEGLSHKDEVAPTDVSPVTSFAYMINKYLEGR